MVRVLVVSSALIVIVCFSPTALASAKCTNRIPLTEYFEHGYDLTEFDAFACPDIGGKRAKFTTLDSCEKRAKYELGDQRKTEYDLPDQFSRGFFRAYLSAHTAYELTTIKEVENEYVDPTAFDVVSSRIQGVREAKYKNSKFYEEMLRIFARRSSVTFIYMRYHSIGLAVERQEFNKTYFTSEFVADVESLPNEFSGNEKTYLDFLRKYGTHVITYADFGATYFRYAELRRNDTRGRKPNEIIEETRKDAFALKDSVDTICEKKSGSRQVLKVHDKNVDYYQVTVGGYANKSIYANQTAMNEAIRALPGLVHAQTRPISLLIEDKDKHESTKKAIEIYVAKSFIKSKVNEMKILLESGREPRKETNETFTKAIQSENIYVAEDLRKIGKDLERAMRFGWK